jgi:hypothetical protein
MIEASKVKRRIAHDPELFTWDNLHLVVEFLKHKRLERSPAACVSAAWVAEARHKYVRTEPRVVDIAKSIAEAVAAEQGAPQGHEPWVNRLTRARGDGRQAVYSEWFETRGHLLETSG